MQRKSRNRFFRSGSGNNLKSKTCPEPFDSAQDNLRRRIQNLKWAGFLAILVLLVGGVGIAETQQAAKVHRIGFLEEGSISLRAHLWEALRQRLRELGYLEGQNIAFESRGADGKVERLADLAAELVRLKVSIIVTAGIQAAHAAKKATTTIPVVMATGADPVGVGLIASLSRPGGNVTGVTSGIAELSGKSLELLKELVPGTRVAIFWNPDNPAHALKLRETRIAARAFGMPLQVLEVRDRGELESAFAAMTRERAGAVVVLHEIVFLQHRKRLVDLAAKSRLPAMYERREYVEAGGLMSYGINFPDNFRRAAIFVDKILKGVKPADLPVEHPTKFELVINLKTAKALGLTIPQSILLRVDEVIE